MQVYRIWFVTISDEIVCYNIQRYSNYLISTQLDQLCPPGPMPVSTKHTMICFVSIQPRAVSEAPTKQTVRYANAPSTRSRKQLDDISALSEIEACPIGNPN